MTISELDNTAKTIRELQTMIEELTNELEAAKDTMKAAMIEQGKEEISGNGWKATWKTVTSSRFDSKAFKAADPTTYANFCKASTVCRFCLN